jgi:hypothetical protein
MPHTYKLLLQKIILKSYYCKSHKLTITTTYYSLTLLHKSLYFLEHKKSYVYEKNLQNASYLQVIVVKNSTQKLLL